jgi:hypothetical protein
LLRTFCYSYQDLLILRGGSPDTLILLAGCPQDILLGCPEDILPYKEILLVVSRYQEILRVVSGRPASSIGYQKILLVV